MRLLALLFAALIAAVPLASRADDAASLLAKHRAFVGWQFGDGTFTSLQLDGEVAKTQHDGTVKPMYTIHEIEAGVVFRTDVTDVKRRTTYHDGFTGRIYWSTDENGFTRPELGDVQKYNLSYDLLRNEATPEMTGTLQGTAQVDGTQTQIVRVSDPKAYPLDLYIDPATGAYKRAVIDPGGTYETTVDILAYTDALPGKKVMSKVSFGEGDSTYTEYTKFQANVPVTPEEMHPPKAVAYWTFGTGAPAAVRLTQYRIYVQATINGVQGNFIFDTGAGSGILLTQNFADRAHVKADGSTVRYGIGGSANESVGHIDTMQIGDSVLHNVVVSTQDLGYHWQQERGVPYAPDGIIGFSLLAGAIVTLNLDAGTMAVQDPSTTAVDQSKGLLATVDLSTGIPRLPMKIDNVAVNASLDTGNAGMVLYSPELHSKYGVRTMVSTGLMQGTYDTAVYSSGGHIAGIGGVSKADCGTIDNISVGPIIYANVGACQTQEWSGREILVGIDFLRHFNYIFDYPHAQIVIIPRKGDS